MAYVEHYFTRFEELGIYHVYNRSVEKKQMFRSSDNFRFFLRQYSKYIAPVANTYAYCLLGNHFHLLIRIHALRAMRAGAYALAPDLTTFRKLSNLGDPGLSPGENGDSNKTAHDVVSHQFRKLFQSYAMAFNKQQGRVGTLFQTPFKRAAVDSENYLLRLVHYIHSNPQSHGLTEDFASWRWSSLGELQGLNNQKIADRRFYEVWFPGSNDLQHFHADQDFENENMELEY